MQTDQHHAGSQNHGRLTSGSTLRTFTYRGGPQGAFLSPLLYSLLVDKVFGGPMTMATMC
jgi:hypothetical protein